MTNSTSKSTTYSTIPSESGADDKTTMQSLNELFGLHYYVTRAVFDVDGKELVYVNDNLWGFMSIYVEGEQVYKGWKFLSFIYTDSYGYHNGHEYRVVSTIRNWISCAQKVTVIKDDKHAQSKVDPVLGGLKGLEILHAVGGAMALGTIVGFVVSYLGL